MMKAILINPFDRTVTERDIAQGLEPIYAALSSGHVKVDTFQIVNLERFGGALNTLYIDDNGRLHRPPIEQGFTLGNFPHVLVGCGLILGSDEAGDSVSTTFSVDQVKAAVRFVHDCAPAAGALN